VVIFIINASMENLRKPAWKFSISAIYAGAKSLYIPHRDFLEFRWKLFLKPGGSHPSGLIGECHRGVSRWGVVMDLCHGERIIQASVTAQFNVVGLRSPRDYCTARYEPREIPDMRVTGILCCAQGGGPPMMGRVTQYK